MSDSLPPIASADVTACIIPATKRSPISLGSGGVFDSSKVFDALREQHLTWAPNPGIGYLPVTGNPYDEAYFAKYQGYAKTAMGRAINEARLRLVARYWPGELLDVGIGCGQFVSSRQAPTYGYDVNATGIRWLQEQELWWDPYDHPVGAACFWDSLEHIANPAAILKQVTRWVFVALPIFNDLAHVLRSKHYRPDEHCWYFTEYGFLEFMRGHGWLPQEVNLHETALGREDIRSYAFFRA